MRSAGSAGSAEGAGGSNITSRDGRIICLVLGSRESQPRTERKSEDEGLMGMRPGGERADRVRACPGIAMALGCFLRLGCVSGSRQGRGQEIYLRLASGEGSGDILKARVRGGVGRYT